MLPELTEEQWIAEIDDIIVSGYTQRRDSEGDMEDVYVYSVQFTRREFEGVGHTKMPPYDFCMGFENSLFPVWYSYTHFIKFLQVCVWRNSLHCNLFRVLEAPKKVCFKIPFQLSLIRSTCLI